MSSGVSRVWQAYNFEGEAKIAWQKLKLVIHNFLNLYFAPHAIINCKSASARDAHSTGLSQMQTPKNSTKNPYSTLKNP